MDYGKTLNLPKTDFPMKASLAQREPEIIEMWDEKEIYKKTLEMNKGNKSYILHDGPPYANGDIHVGTALNKVLKDIVIKYKSLTGHYAPYVPGWDTHGLPTELKAIKEMGINRHEADPIALRDKCKEFALKYLDRQRNQFKRLGVNGDWANPYITLKPEFESKQIEVFGEMAKKGCIYKGLKPVYWCADCETALAEAEIEYQEDTTNTVYVKFEVCEDKGLFSDIAKAGKVYFVIWTTTIWTLPGNLAICLNKEFDYAVVKVGNEYLVIAEGLVEEVMNASSISDYSVVAKYKGSELEHMKCKHPFLDRDSLIILGDHVTLDAGTGCVHTAPGHGHEDFEVCKQYDISVVVPLDSKGILNEDAGMFKGLEYFKANKVIAEHLKNTGYLLAEQVIQHQYAHCWRCKEPVLYRATEQWFASIDKFRDNALEAIKGVKWIPGWGEDRITNMVRDRGDWCISRQRTWGVPIPIFYCEDCNSPIINEKTISAVSKLFKEKGSNAWYELSAEEILPKDIVCDCGKNKFKKETDIMDVWFDSGSSHIAVLGTRNELTWPADMYLEGSDQHRGWFQSSLLTSVATKGIAPYKEVLTHGFVMDGEGRKMSKSLGNTIDPLKVIEQYGADVLRLWVVSVDYQNDVRISQDILKQMSEVYRKIRNTARFILGNISDFDPNSDKVGYEKLLEIDKWALLKLNSLIKRVTESYENHQYHLVYHSIYNFCVIDMSNFYLDVLKDRLYTQKADSQARRAAQTVMYEILVGLVKMLTPVLAFTTEEIWKYMPHEKDHNTESVQLNLWPKCNAIYEDAKLEEKWDKILDLRTDVLKILEAARAEKVIGNSLSASLKIYPDDKNYEFFSKIEDLLTEVFIVSGVKVIKEDASSKAIKGEKTGIYVELEIAQGEKCERCWMISQTVGQDEGHKTLCSRCVEILAKS